jgi:endonuclease YncB( thermonuclease family)
MKLLHIAAVLAIFLYLGIAVSCFSPGRRPVDETRGDRPPVIEHPAAPKSGPASSEPSIEVPRTSRDAVLVPNPLVARVVGVHDGDTITVLDQSNTQYKIRLSGIDAPELHQDFGRRSKENLANMVFGKDVSITHDKVDRYGRIVGKIVLNNVDVNLEQVEAGLAWHFKRYQNEQPPSDRSLYSEAETRARNSKRGLWLQPNAVPPWDYRSAERR